MKEQQKWTEEILGSLENVQKAVPDTDFLSKMESLATTFGKTPKVIPMSKVFLLAASLAALIFINAVVVSKTIDNDTNSESYSQMEVSGVTGEYDLKPIQSFYYE